MTKSNDVVFGSVFEIGQWCPLTYRTAPCENENLLRDNGGVTKNLIVYASDPGAEKGMLELFGPPVFSGLLVIIGWIVVNKLQANRERRKQIREQIVDMKNQLDEIEALAIKYHTSERILGDEGILVAKLGRFEKLYESLVRYEGAGRWVRAVPRDSLKLESRKLQRLRQALTLEHFADEHVSAVAHDSELVQGIYIAVDEACDQLEKARLVALD